MASEEKGSYFHQCPAQRTPHSPHERRLNEAGLGRESRLLRAPALARLPDLARRVENGNQIAPVGLSEPAETRVGIRPVDGIHECIDIGTSLCTIVHVIGVLIHVECE